MTGGSGWRTPLATVLGLAAAFVIPPGFSANSDCRKPWIFFDLGNTVIASNPGQDFRYIPGAHAYLRGLRERGYPIGMITNVPEKWGVNRAEKLRALKKMVRENWTKDAAAEPMDWSDFPDSAIVLPAHDSDRKPAPNLFRAALAKVALEEGRRDCPVYYLGEEPAEIAAAESSGLRGYVVLQDPAVPFPPYERFERR